MIAALYVRKSTDQAVADDAKSVHRQIQHGRDYAARKGWTVADEHVYVDDGVSGGEFSAARRPAFARILNALKPKAPFEVLIVSELSRLGREQIKTGIALQQIDEAGVRIFAYLDDKELVLTSATDRFLVSAVNFGSELELGRLVEAIAAGGQLDGLLRALRAREDRKVALRRSAWRSALSARERPATWRRCRTSC